MLRVLLLQLPVPNNPGANIPLAAGYLKAWAAHEGLLERATIDLLPRDIADTGGDAALVDAIVSRRPDILGLSLYTWNSERSLAIARMAREALPGLTVIVGGPEVQTDNDWVLTHPAVDLAVLGEGEQTFADLIRAFSGLHVPLSLSGEPALVRGVDVSTIAGLAVHTGGAVRFTATRSGMEDLSVVPSPYLAGYLELRPGEMALIECSRWCPYRCSFCLYGRSMGSRLGRRYFPAERVAAEVAWAKERGAGAVHFVEANLNLLPYFRELMDRLRVINADRSLRFYAELRGEHLREEMVDALMEAGLYAAEIGLQSANPEALLAVDRRTDLGRWAEGARRLYRRGVEVFLDVILGLPCDTRTTVMQTVDWIAEQQLGPYDIFTLQVLPGTGVRADAERWGLRFQDRPPYYVLANHQLSYTELRALRWELREAAGLDPIAIEGMPEPLFEQRPLSPPPTEGLRASGWPVTLIEVDTSAALSWQTQGTELARQVASHVTVVAHGSDLTALQELCLPIAGANPTIHWDLLLDGRPAPADLRTLIEQWPHETGYLDRVAVYKRPQPEPPYVKTSPRIFLLMPIDGDAPDPLAYEGLAEMLWLLDGVDLEQELEQAWRRGGAGVVLPEEAAEQALGLLQDWRERTGWRVWQAIGAQTPATQR